MLELEGVSRRFGDRRALEGLTFAVPPGQVVGLLGPNGSGKTTAMRIVFGVIDADAGTVRYRGAPVDAAVRRRFGYMPEERGLYPRMTVRDHLVYLARLTGMPRDRAEARAGALIDRLGLSDRAGDRVEQLSQGNQQRVQLGAAIVHEPEVVVLDEPFSALDPVAVDALQGQLTEMAASGRTVLFSSHQLDLVEAICESVIMIDRGRTVMTGALAELKRASGRRRLRVGWDGRVERLPLQPGEDPLAALDAARARGPVEDFGLELPSLNELFLEAVGRRGAEA